MKRRNFLGAVGASFAALSLLTPNEAWAAKKTTRGKATKSTAAKKRTTKKSGRTPTAAATTTAPATTVDSARTPLSANAFDTPPPPAEPWRSYEIVTSITRLDTNGPARVWLPLALEHDTNWQRLRDHRWRGNFDHAGLARNAADNMEIFTATWDGTPDPREAGAGMPILEIVSRVDVRERHFDLTRRHRAEERPEALRHDVQPLPFLVDATRLRQSAEHIIGRIKDPLARGKAVYDWVLEQSLSPHAATENTGVAALFAQPRAIATSAAGDHGTANRVAGEGIIDEGMAMTLAFVGLCRAAGLPARPLFGLCIDASRLSPGLGHSGGAEEADRSHAVPRCRAEFFAPGYGWIPVAPGEVKQALSRDGAALGEAKSNALKKLLFGFWEMNWIALNAATGVSLPESGGVLPFFAVPLAKALTHTGGEAHGDWLRQPGAFAYRIDARRIDSDAAAPWERNAAKAPGSAPNHAGASVPGDPQDEDEDDDADEAGPGERGGGEK